MRLITNQTDKNHFQIVQQILEPADELWIAVAFMKLSGLRKLKNELKSLAENGSQITVVVGRNFAISEPDALRVLLKMSNHYPGFRLFLAKMNKQTFHPKIYLSRKGNTFKMLTGSANLTDGGFTTNHEASIFVEGKVKSEIWTDAMTFFEQVSNRSFSDIPDKGMLDDYELLYEKASKAREKGKFDIDPTAEKFELNVNKIKNYLAKMDRKELKTRFETKEANYAIASEILHKLAKKDSTRIKLEEFKKLFFPLLNVKENPEKNLLDSGGLERHKNEIIQYYRSVTKVVRLVVENKSKSPSQVFDLAMNVFESRNGLGVNLIGEIMMAINPDQFANLNNNSLGALMEITGRKLKKTTRLYNGRDYQIFCDLLFEVTRLLEFKNALHTDSFLDKIYWKNKNEMKIKITPR